MSAPTSNDVTKESAATGSKFYICYYCKNYYCSVEVLNAHIRDHHQMKDVNIEKAEVVSLSKPKIFRCYRGTCKLYFNKLALLKKHINTKHGQLYYTNNTKNLNTYSCIYCNITFYSNDLLKNHVAKCHEPLIVHQQYSKYCCSFCKLYFESESSANEHITEIHHGVELNKSTTHISYTCRNCYYFYCTGSELDNHRMTCKYCLRPQNIVSPPPSCETKLFICCYCGCKLSSSEELTYHLSNCDQSVINSNVSSTQTALKTKSRQSMSEEGNTRVIIDTSVASDTMPVKSIINSSVVSNKSIPILITQQSKYKYVAPHYVKPKFKYVKSGNVIAKTINTKVKLNNKQSVSKTVVNLKSVPVRSNISKSIRSNISKSIRSNICKSIPVVPDSIESIPFLETGKSMNINSASPSTSESIQIDSSIVQDICQPIPVVPASIESIPLPDTDVNNMNSVISPGNYKSIQIDSSIVQDICQPIPVVPASIESIPLPDTGINNINSVISSGNCKSIQIDSIREPDTCKSIPDIKKSMNINSPIIPVHSKSMQIDSILQHYVEKYQHLEIITNKHFGCCKCEKRFSTRFECLNHILSHQGVTHSNAISKMYYTIKKSFSCKICCQSSFSLKTFKTHKCDIVESNKDGTVVEVNIQDYKKRCHSEGDESIDDIEEIEKLLESWNIPDGLILEESSDDEMESPMSPTTTSPSSSDDESSMSSCSDNEAPMSPTLEDKGESNEHVPIIIPTEYNHDSDEDSIIEIENIFDNWTVHDFDEISDINDGINEEVSPDINSQDKEHGEKISENKKLPEQSSLENNIKSPIMQENLETRNNCEKLDRKSNKKIISEESRTHISNSLKNETDFKYGTTDEISKKFVIVESKYWICSICKIELKSKILVTEHVKTHHNFSEHDLVLLLNNHQVQNQYKCNLCNVNVDSIDQCKIHLANCKYKLISKIDVSSYICYSCDKDFQSSSLFDTHVSQVHNNVICKSYMVNSIKFECNICHKLYQFIGHAKLHADHCQETTDSKNSPQGIIEDLSSVESQAKVSSCCNETLVDNNSLQGIDLCNQEVDIQNTHNSYVLSKTATESNVKMNTTSHSTSNIGENSEDSKKQNEETAKFESQNVKQVCEKNRIIESTRRVNDHGVSDSGQSVRNQNSISKTNDLVLIKEGCSSETTQEAVRIDDISETNNAKLLLERNKETVSKTKVDALNVVSNENTNKEDVLVVINKNAIFKKSHKNEEKAQGNHNNIQQSRSVVPNQEYNVVKDLNTKKNNSTVEKSNEILKSSKIDKSKCKKSNKHHKKSKKRSKEKSPKIKSDKKNKTSKLKTCKDSNHICGSENQELPAGESVKKSNGTLPNLGSKAISTCSQTKNINQAVITTKVKNISSVETEQSKEEKKIKHSTQSSSPLSNNNASHSSKSKKRKHSDKHKKSSKSKKHEHSKDKNSTAQNSSRKRESNNDDQNYMKKHKTSHENNTLGSDKMPVLVLQNCSKTIEPSDHRLTDYQLPKNPETLTENKISESEIKNNFTCELCKSQFQSLLLCKKHITRNKCVKLRNSTSKYKINKKVVANSTTQSVNVDSLVTNISAQSSCDKTSEVVLNKETIQCQPERKTSTDLKLYYQCLLCSHKFMSKIKASNHVLTFHSKNSISLNNVRDKIYPVFQCKLCKLKFKTNIKFNEHLSQHKNSEERSISNTMIDSRDTNLVHASQISNNKTENKQIEEQISISEVINDHSKVDLNAVVPKTCVNNANVNSESDMNYIVIEIREDLNEKTEENAKCNNNLIYIKDNEIRMVSEEYFFTEIQNNIESNSFQPLEIVNVIPNCDYNNCVKQNANFTTWSIKKQCISLL